jgi:glycosyltransferase involved in cell wall biosynthesis
MRIAVDARELAGQPTGVGRYLAEILSEWARMPEAAEHELIFCAPAPVDLTPWPALRARVETEAGGGTPWEQRVLPRLARRARASVLFCPGYSGPIRDRTPLVVAIHDVSFSAHPEWFRWREGLRRRLVTRAAARRAARVLTISEFSRREIVEHLGVQASKVQVIYPGVSSVAAHGQRPATRDPLILYVGSIFNRRHVPETIKAVTRLARRHPDVRLAIVGDNRTFPRVELGSLVADSTLIALHSYVPDDVLADLYRRARAFVFLSAYEGFGLTPLEALAGGVPIVVLDTPVAREVYGGAAIYVAGPDPRLIEPALERALTDEAERQRVLHAAPAVLARYSWTACARGVLQALIECGA